MAVYTFAAPSCASLQSHEVINPSAIISFYFFDFDPIATLAHLKRPIVELRRIYL